MRKVDSLRPAWRYPGDERWECRPHRKICYDTWDAAARACLYLRDTKGKRMWPYVGKPCGQFHIGHPKGGQADD